VLRLGRTLAIMSLAVCTASCVMAEILPDLRSVDSLQAARAAEEKGDLARAHRDYATAAMNYQKALRFDGQNSKLLNKLGIAQLKLENRGAARRSFNQAIKYDPRNTTALNNLGALCLLDKKYKQALRYLKEALALDESSASAHLNIAGVWMGLNEIDRAMTEYSRAFELNPDLMQDDGNGLAAQVRTPEQRARISYLIAKAYAKRGNLDGALDYLRRAKDDRFPRLSDVYKDQEFASLWADPRLAKIIKR